MAILCEAALSGLRNGRMLLLMPLLLYSSPIFAQQKKLRIGLIDFYPFATFTEAGPEGYLIDYVRELLADGPWQIAWKSVSIDRAVQELRGGSLDLVLTLFKIEERARVLRFSKKPIMESKGGICLKRAASVFPPTRPLRILHVQGTLLPKSLTTHLLIPLSHTRAQERMIRMLELDRADGIFSPKPEIILLAAQKAGLKIGLECYAFADQSFPIYIASSAGLAVEEWNDFLQRVKGHESFELFMKRKTMRASRRLDEVGSLHSDRLRIALGERLKSHADLPDRRIGAGR